MTAIKKPLLLATRLQKSRATICFVLLYLLNHNVSFSQSISFCGGPSLPYGLYASKDFTKLSPGMANTGYAISIVADDNSKPRMVNTFIQFSHNNNKIDEHALTNIYKFIDPGYKSAQAYKSWSQNILILGGRFNYFAYNFNLYAKVGIGMGWFSSYGYNLYSDSLGVVKFNVLNDNALTFMAGVGSNIYLRQGLSAVLGYDFFYAEANYGYEKFTNNNGNLKAAVAAEVKPSLLLGNFYFGLRFQLKK
jgi:hypothetical protein